MDEELVRSALPSSWGLLTRLSPSQAFHRLTATAYLTSSARITMSLTANGTLQTVSSGNRITGTFTDRNGKTIYLSVNFQSPVPQFSATNAVVTYRTDSQLTGQDNVNGIIGATNVNLNFGQGEVVTASYTNPTQQASVSGNATWS
ncbi:hypothetical protein BC629DRAFT_1590160 [Irpex lacteus]|nr:hypothetical protein BC629DRAFT_1590160 [Irpex lacteus]